MRASRDGQVTWTKRTVWPASALTASGNDVRVASHTRAMRAAVPALARVLAWLADRGAGD